MFVCMTCIMLIDETKKKEDECIIALEEDEWLNRIMPQKILLERVNVKHGQGRRILRICMRRRGNEVFELESVNGEIWKNNGF